MSKDNSTVATSPPYSLTKTILQTGVAWHLCALVTVGAILLTLFEHHIQKRFDQSLQRQLHDLVAAVTVTNQGEATIGWRPNSPKFNQPVSGWYWQITALGGDVLFQSDSLYSDVPMPLIPHDDSARFHWVEFDGPLQPLRAGVQTVTFPDSESHYQFVVTGPIADIQQDVWSFAGVLAGVLLILAVAMAISTWLQVKQILKPVHQLEQEITAIRQGEQVHIERDLPVELQSVGDELNNLIEHNSSILERSRLQASNLAHALKNPISVLRNELQNIDEHSADVMQEQLDKLSQNANTHLSRARLAGSMKHLAAQTNVSESISDILFSMELLYKEKGVDLSFSCAPKIAFKGDQHDLEEVLGNLIDNACKWCRIMVMVSVEIQENTLAILIEDDGPGIPMEQHATVFKPGQRLDETTEGTGLGLHIVQDIVLLYGGQIVLDKSELGGAKLRVELPRGADYV